MSKTKALTVFLLLSCLLISPVIYAEPSAKAIVAKAIGRMNSLGSLSATVQIQFGDGAPTVGQLKYQAGKIYVKFGNGKVLATNGRFIWLYSASSAITGQQDVTGRSGGLGWAIGGMDGKVLSSSGGYIVRLRNEKKTKEVLFKTDKSGLLRFLQIKGKEGKNILTLKLSGVKTGMGFPLSVFSFHPDANCKTILNPLNYKE